MNEKIHMLGYFELKDIEECFVKKDHAVRAFTIFDMVIISFFIFK